MLREEATLIDIFNSAQCVVEFRGSLNKEDFLLDKKTQSAVIHQLLIIGEAVKRLSDEFRSKHPEISWLECEI